jgi:antitoxin (DNA-binding transcriptional repressor) of toxin-antitoxin stability system
MAQNVDIALEAVIAEPESVFRRVERDQETVTVLHFGEPVAVITPAPIAKTIGDEHREQLEKPAEDSHYFDVMETRRLLGL